MVIKEKDRKNKYKRFKKYKDGINLIESSPSNDLEFIFIKAFNEKELEKRYVLIYDYMCDYLDKNVCCHCDFENNKCIANRLGKSVYKENGCCYFNKEGFCSFFKNKKCSRPNIACKLFMCNYMEEKVIKQRSIPKNYLLLDFFFNNKQKNILRRSYRRKKEEVIKDLLKNK